MLKNESQYYSIALKHKIELYKNRKFCFEVSKTFCYPIYLLPNRQKKTKQNTPNETSSVFVTESLIMKSGLKNKSCQRK